MDLLLLAQQAILLINQAEPTLSAGAAALTMGTAAVQVYEKGKQVVTYWIRKRGDTEDKTPPAVGGIIGAAGNVPVAPAKAVAIVVDINQRSLQDVARCLQERHIDADLFLVTNDPAYGPKAKFLSETDTAAWSQVVEDFRSVWERIKYERGHVPAHIFMSVPVVIAYGMGVVWGTVDHATVYHWRGSKYTPMLEIERGLRDPQQRDS